MLRKSAIDILPQQEDACCDGGAPLFIGGSSLEMIPGYKKDAESRSKPESQSDIFYVIVGDVPNAQRQSYVTVHVGTCTPHQ